MLGRMAIRGISKTVLDNLEASALRHDRSVEAEARQALSAWVEPLALEAERSKRSAEVGMRLMRLLEQLNDSKTGEVLRPSQIAEQIGESRASEVENWFLGREEPTFEQLNTLAKLFEADPDWLKHGQRVMFPVKHQQLSTNAVEAAKWMAEWDEGEPVAAVHLLREASKAGSLLIVKESERRQFRTFHTGIHVSEVIGNGGESSLAHLWVTLALLFKRHHRGNVHFMVFSYITQPAAVKQLMSGQVNALNIVHESSKVPWWEDVWHADMYLKNSYWPGWLQLCERINRVVGKNPHLAEQMEAIRRGELTVDFTPSV